jgi:uncharacterized membrane protein HdeD (DUF308 family)
LERQIHALVQKDRIPPGGCYRKISVYKIEDPYHFEKYDTKTSTALNVWSWVQLMMILFFISYFFGSIARINSLDGSYIFWYGGFIFLSVFALTELMDRNRYAIIWEAIRSGLGLYFLYQQNDWFGANTYVSSITYILGAYFILSFIVTGWIVLQHKKEDAMQTAI